MAHLQRWMGIESNTLFRDFYVSQLNGVRVKKRPHLGNMLLESDGLMVEHDCESTPPLAVSFCKTVLKSHILAVSDEDGYVSLYDTQRKLTKQTTCRDKSRQCRLSEWIAHDNAIFDLCWMKDDACILTASGDQKIKIWDVEKKTCIGIMSGHTGSVKSLCSHQSNKDVFVSGSRDGSFAIWDLRIKSNCKKSQDTPYFSSIAIVSNAHSPQQGKRKRVVRTNRRKSSTSITSVLYLKDELSIASSGAVDSIIKFWDTRNLNSSISQMSPCLESSPSEQDKSLHGISSLSQDSSGMLIAASCMDNNVYLYNVLRHHNGPVNTFSGGTIDSFYVKSVISPDGFHILSGSSDGEACIWQVNKPQALPIKLKGHRGEVTAVDWCSSDSGKLTTSSDDFTVRIWNTNNQRSSLNPPPTPSSLRKRVSASPRLKMECRKLFFDENSKSPEKINSKKDDDSINSEDLCPEEDQEIVPEKEIEFSTPESSKKRSLSSLNGNFELQKNSSNASAELNSPLSVLTPSSLKKRTIRDYFAFSPPSTS